MSRCQQAAHSFRTVKWQFDWNYLVGAHYQELMDTLKSIRIQYSPRPWCNDELIITSIKQKLIPPWTRTTPLWWPPVWRARPASVCPSRRSASPPPPSWSEPPHQCPLRERERMSGGTFDGKTHHWCFMVNKNSGMEGSNGWTADRLMHGQMDEWWTDGWTYLRCWWWWRGPGGLVPGPSCRRLCLNRWTDSIEIKQLLFLMSITAPEPESWNITASIKNSTNQTWK